MTKCKHHDTRVEIVKRNDRDEIVSERPEVDLERVSRANRPSHLDKELEKLRSRLVWEIREWPTCNIGGDEGLEVIAHPLYFDAYGDPSSLTEFKWHCERCYQNSLHGVEQESVMKGEHND